MAGPVGVYELPRAREQLVGVSSEVVSLGLDQVGWNFLRSTRKKSILLQNGWVQQYFPPDFSHGTLIFVQYTEIERVTDLVLERVWIKKENAINYTCPTLVSPLLW